MIPSINSPIRLQETSKPNTGHRLIAQAQDDARRHNVDSPILKEAIVYSDVVDPPAISSNISLVVQPVSTMTWGKWRRTRRALDLFYQN